MDKELRTYGDRFKVCFSPELLDGYAASESLWFESDDEVEAALTRGEERARLLKWVRKQMRQRLTAKQRRCIDLYYFRGLSYEEVGREVGCSLSSACRTVKRGIRRLRTAAKVDPPEGLRPRLRRQRRRAESDRDAGPNASPAAITYRIRRRRRTI